MHEYICRPTADGTQSAGPILGPWFQAWARSQGLSLEAGSLNLCADRDVEPPEDHIPIREWDSVMTLKYRKETPGYDPRLYPIVLMGIQRAWLFRWAALPDLHRFVSDTAECLLRRRCEVIGELNFTAKWRLSPGDIVTLAFEERPS